MGEDVTVPRFVRGAPAAEPPSLVLCPVLIVLSILIVLIVLIVSAPGVPGLALLAQEPPPAVSELAVPRPDLSAMEEAARRKVESMQATLERIQGEAEARPQEVAEGFGYLGQLFHAFQLLEAAATCYDNAQRLQGEDYRWPYLLGLVQNAQGELESAVRSYQRVLELEPGDLPGLVRLANALLDLNRADAARRRFEDVLEAEPESAVALYGLGKVAASRGEFEDAVELFERALAADPEATAIHYPLGQAYRRLGDLERARDHLSRRGQGTAGFSDPLGEQVARLAKGTAFEVALAMARDEENFSAPDFLGFALSQFGDVKGAIEQLRHGLALQRESGGENTTRREEGRIHYVLGGLLVNDGRDDEAMEHFQKAADLDPDLLDARVKLANALARGRRFEEASTEYGKVLERSPTNGAVLFKRAAVLLQLGRHGEARSHLAKAASLDPRNGEVRMGLASIEATLGDLEEAMAGYRTALELELDPDRQVVAHVRLAELWQRRGAAEQALAEYDRALELDPDSFPAHSGRAALLGRLGRYREASRTYALLVTLAPRNSAVRLGEVTALIFSGRHAEARTRLEAGLAVLPRDLTLKDVLARHLAACPDPTVRDGPRAVELARELYEAVPSLESMETLAMAYAEAGRYDEAVRWQEKVLGQSREKELLDRLGRLRANLERYRARQSCCAPGS